MERVQKVLLAVLDGWGIRREREGNAILLAGTPHLERISRGYPTAELQASGLSVGLPEGQMGNSEVGHTNIGAGRIVYQELVRISRACTSGELLKNTVITSAMDRAKALPGEQSRDDRSSSPPSRDPGGDRKNVLFTHPPALHLLGLVSPGGVHSHTDHLKALLSMAKERGLLRVFVHAFLDGRDTPPQSGLGYIEDLESFLRKTQTGQIATVTGRYYAMDRDKRWDRTQMAFKAMVRGEGRRARSGVEAVKTSYAENVTDEFVVPTVIVDAAENPIAKIQDGDVALFFNFRADRARQLTRALALPDFREFERGRLKLGEFVCMTQYDRTFNLPVVFPPDQPKNIFPEILSQRGFRQFRTAETEKYAHVTFFFNGGREVVFPGEDRLLVPSPREVKTYDQRPQMSAREVTAELIQRIESGKHEFALVNFANPDMVGHTGILGAAIEAVRVVDECLGKIADACSRAGWAAAITADHGNCEQMIDPSSGGPHTAHTLNPVPFYLMHSSVRGRKLRDGILADIAPTLLELMGLPQPPEMTGRSLFI
jgi:2,3-bisphosphoglycerate-independent phosphoglycerate mutase